MGMGWETGLIKPASLLNASANGFIIDWSARYASDVGNVQISVTVMVPAVGVLDEENTRGDVGDKCFAQRHC